MPRKESVGPNHPDVSLGLKEVGRILIALGRVDEGCRDLEEALAGHAPGARRVGLGDVQAEGDDQRLGPELAHDLQGLVQLLQVAGVEDVLGQGEVPVEAPALALPHLVGEAGEVRE